MTKIRIYLFILIGLVISLQACEKQLQKRILFSIGGIILDNDVVAQGDLVNISAIFDIIGTTNESRPSVIWESNLGTFENANLLSTIWTAPSDYLGDIKIKLTATFMGHTDIAERALRIVKTSADGWGSLSGNIYSENQTPLNNVIVMTSTGERDTTDNEGFFYLADLPQGGTGLEFLNIPYAWATELSQQIEITGGSHEHLGNILFYTSTPAEISDFENLPEHQAILSIEHKNLNLVKFHELYRANDVNGSGAILIRTLEPGITEFQIQEDSENAFYAFKSVPLHGETSAYSDSGWTHIAFINVIDPDAESSYFIYTNFFNATLNWRETGYESYYKGFRVVEDLDTGWAYISPLLGITSRSYSLITQPGQTGNYYVIAISHNDLYNSHQPEEQKVKLVVPSLEPPQNFRGTLQADYSIRLLWEPIANNNIWYSGYLLEKKVVTDTSTIDWEELTRFATSVTGTFTDELTDSGNIYHYRISSIAYSSGPGSVYYSAMDSISISTK